MIYEKNNVYYLKKGNDYEIANISIKYNRIKKRNVLVITGSEIIEQLEEKLVIKKSMWRRWGINN